MIKSFEELGEALADFENRISCLEMSTPVLPVGKLQGETPPVRKFSPREWDELQQLKARLLHLENKVMELRAKRKATY